MLPNIKQFSIVGSLTVLDDKTYRYDIPGRQQRYTVLSTRKCKCKCGKIVYRSNSDLLKSPNSRCRTCDMFSRILPPLMPTEIIAVVKYNCTDRHRNIIWKLTDEQTIDIITRNCFYCGVLPNYTFSRRKGAEAIYNGIDRLNSKKGYTYLNCVPCCKVCNFMKQSLSLEDFLAKIKAIYENINLNHYEKVM